MIRSETREHIATIELSRPEKKNALNSAMYIAMTDALAAAEADLNVRAILMHGTRDCFTAGNDLTDFLGNPASASKALDFLYALTKVEKPVLAAVGGPAVGIGTTLLLHCDLVYATPGARFQLPFVPLGLVPEAASSLLLPRIAGHARAARWLLLGQAFTPNEALAVGIVTEIVPEDALLERAREAAATIAALPPKSVQRTKQLMKQPLAAQVADQMAEEARLVVERLRSAEAKEAMTAFLEKRKPDFSRF